VSQDGIQSGVQGAWTWLGVEEVWAVGVRSDGEGGVKTVFDGDEGVCVGDWIASSRSTELEGLGRFVLLIGCTSDGV
jgi:hypothetical protein